MDTAPTEMFAPVGFPPLLVESRIASAPRLTAPEPKSMASALLLTAPATFTGPFPGNETPPLKRVTSPAPSPRVTVPVLLKAAALVTVVVAPVRDTP
ncbi:MAG: hypothetical protein BWY88_01119 [Synergistetes bacterium ADurb.Bin520]|nr:MAG: hypothetical protein BWY88_01119 [Synergistetes bacterium ADurb.Bin520]